MKLLKTIGLSILGLLILLVIIGFFLPSTSIVERSMVINASPAIVFDQVNTVQNWEKWSPWKEMDPEMVNTYGDQPSGTGAYYTWIGPKAGEGKLTITESEPTKLIKSDLDFGEMGVAKCDYSFEPAENGTKMTWKFESELGGNPMSRWMGFIMKGMLEEQFDMGMNKMNSYVGELKETSAVGRIEGVEVMNLPEIHYIAIHDTANVSTIGQKIGLHLGALNEEIEKQRLEISGSPFTIYYSESETNFDMDVAMQINKPAAKSNKIISNSIPSGKAVVALYYGPYESSGMGHAAANKYIMEHPEIVVDGAPREVYVTDSESNPDTSMWLTQIIYPIK
ncbi:MAG: SRPBCC family protein [Bacteroidia bacterium]